MNSHTERPPTLSSILQALREHERCIERGGQEKSGSQPGVYRKPAIRYEEGSEE